LLFGILILVAVCKLPNPKKGGMVFAGILLMDIKARAKKGVTKWVKSLQYCVKLYMVTSLHFEFPTEVTKSKVLYVLYVIVQCFIEIREV
jgi:hypothetical protein